MVGVRSVRLMSGGVEGDNDAALRAGSGSGRGMAMAERWRGKRMMRERIIVRKCLADAKLTSGRAN